MLKTVLNRIVFLCIIVVSNSCCDAQEANIISSYMYDTTGSATLDPDEYVANANTPSETRTPKYSYQALYDGDNTQDCGL